MSKMNLPNKLTMLRLCLVPVMTAFLLLPDALIPWQIAYGVGLVLFALTSLTDMLDGKIARARNLITNFGKFMDPIADKLLVMSALIVLTAQGRMPDWVCILILAREFVVSGFPCSFLRYCN